MQSNPLLRCLGGCALAIALAAAPLASTSTAQQRVVPPASTAAPQGREPSTAPEFVAAGERLLEQGDYRRALQSFTSALRIDARCVTAYVQRGCTWDACERFDEAIRDYNAALTLDPANVAALDNRGCDWALQGSLDKALSDFSAALALDPRNATIYRNRAGAWAATGQFDRAIRDYSEMIRLEPNQPDAYMAIAWLRATCSDARYRQGTEAVRLAVRAGELTNWKDPGVIETLAAAYAEQRDFKQAVLCQTKAVNLSPTPADQQTALDRLAIYQAKRPYREVRK